MANYKLPQKAQDKLASFPETGMGYQKVILSFSDGKVVPNIIISNGQYFSTDADIDIAKLKKITIQKK
jgi:hypothetical protein